MLQGSRFPLSRRTTSKLPKGLVRLLGLLAAVVMMMVMPAPGHAASRTVVVFPVAGDNVAPEILRATGELLRDHLQRTGMYNVVVPPPGPGETTEPSPAQAAQQAAALGGDLAVVLRITHFGTSARIRLNAYAVPSGQVAYWDSIVTSSGPDELDTVVQRLVHAMVTGKPVRESAEIDTVTDKEGQTLNRRAANRSFGVHVFTLLPLHTADDTFSAVPGGGIFWLYDARSWMADVSFDLGGRDGHVYYDGAIGGYYPFLREDITPYVGGVVRLAYMQLGGAGSGGITLQPTAGILIGRLSSVQLRGEAGYFFNTFGERPPSTSVDQSQRYGHGFTVEIGLGF